MLRSERLGTFAVSTKRACLVAHRGEVDDAGDVLVAEPGVSPHVLIDSQDSDTVEACRVGDDLTVPFGQDLVVGGVPRHGQARGDTRDGQVVHDEGT